MFQLRSGSCLPLLILLANAAYGQEDEEPSSLHQGEQGKGGTGYWEFRLGVFDRDDDGDGNPFVDETLTVIEPALIYDRNFTDKFGMSLMLTFDYVSSASIERLSKFDGQSGASGDTYTGLDLGFRSKPRKEREYGYGLHISKEYDYTSIGLNGSITQELADGDASIKTSLNVFFDTVDLIRFDGQDFGTDDRTTIAGTVSWYQIISPRMWGEFGFSLAAQSGFLETPYNAVIIEDPSLPPNPNLDNNARGFEVTENLPDSRVRAALFGKVRRSLGSGRSFQLGGRLYYDDWGITALSIQPMYVKLLGADTLWELRYRYYTQTAADAYDSQFLTVEDERTQDSDLASFDSHMFGTHFVWKTGKSSSWDAGIDYLVRSDGLDHIFATVGWKWSF